MGVGVGILEEKKLLFALIPDPSTVIGTPFRRLRSRPFEITNFTGIAVVLNPICQNIAFAIAVIEALENPRSRGAKNGLPYEKPPILTRLGSQPLPH